MPCRTAIVLLAIMFLSGCESSTTPQPQPNTAGPPPVPTVGAPVPTTTAPAATAPAASASAEGAFIAAYRQAHEKKDVEALLQLYCLDGVPSDMRDIMRGNIRDELKAPIDTIEIIPSSDAQEVRNEGGVIWKSNLKPVATLNVTYQPGGVFSSASNALGLKNGRYLIPVGVRQ